MVSCFLSFSFALIKDVHFLSFFQTENFLVPKTFTKETICLRIVGESSHGLLICREGFFFFQPLFFYPFILREERGEREEIPFFSTSIPNRYHKAKRGQKTFLDLYDSEKHSLTTLYIHPRAHVNVCSASVDSSLSLLSFTMFYSTQMGNRKVFYLKILLLFFF